MRSEGRYQHGEVGEPHVEGASSPRTIPRCKNRRVNVIRVQRQVHGESIIQAFNPNPNLAGGVACGFPVPVDQPFIHLSSPQRLLPRTSKLPQTVGFKRGVFSESATHAEPIRRPTFCV